MNTRLDACLAAIGGMTFLVLLYAGVLASSARTGRFGSSCELSRRFPLESRSLLTDSLFDSLRGAVCGTAGRSVARTRQTGEYVWHALTRPDAFWQGRSISS